VLSAPLKQTIFLRRTFPKGSFRHTENQRATHFSAIRAFETRFGWGHHQRKYRVVVKLFHQLVGIQRESR
jgi:hypothetical protein